jgi:hypothetical protein
VTSPALHIGKGLSLPIDAATQTFAFIARKGAGKTYTAGKLVELLLDAGVQVVVLDTVGNWYGLRLASDGKRSGFDVPVLGGLRGDIPLEAAGGALIADIVVDTGRPMVLDVSQWSKADRQRFAAAFGERLWLRKKGERHPAPVHLVIEESQLIVPQDVRGDTATMVGVYEEIIRLGRNYGIGVSMITQRPQSVNKEVLNQTECLFVGQVNGAQERDALKKWITHQGMDVHLIDELPSLPIGTFYVWSPQWLQLLKRVEILPKKTFDASATPKVGDKRERRELKALDLADLQEQLKATIEKAKAEDPRELRRQIAALKAELSKGAHIMRDKLPPPKTVEKFVLKDGQLARAEQLVAKIGAAMEQCTAVQDRARTLKDDIAKIGIVIQTAIEKSRIPEPRLSPPPPRPLARPRTERPAAAPRHAVELQNGGTVSGPQQRILNALAWAESFGLPTQRREKVAFLSDASPKSSAFMNNLGALRSAGLIDYPSQGFVSLTESGRAIAHVDESAPQTSDELQQAICAKLPAPQARIVQAVVRAYPHALHRQAVAEQADASPASSAFMNNLGALRSLGLLEYPQQGMVAAAPVLFIEGAHRT